jgi:fucose 4-O-acetylase-like acetyltransferase
MKNARLIYINNIRSLVIILVVAMHSSVCYSGIGGWYYKEGIMESLGLGELVVFAFLQSYTQAWFLGILFFISGSFAAAALAKKGRAAFLRERFFRLGLPLLAYMFIVAPFIYFVLMRNIASNEPAAKGGLAVSYARYLLDFAWLGETGPLWFNEALLLFCLVFALFHRRNQIPRPSGRGMLLFRGSCTQGFNTFLTALKGGVLNPFGTNKAQAKSAMPQTPSAMPGKEAIFLIILGTGIAAFLIRLIFPIGTGVLNLQFSFFASYIVLFALGVRAGENDWLPQITGGPNDPMKTAAGTGRFWFIAALALGIPLWFIIMISGGALEGTILVYGGPYWQSAAYALWESFTAIAFSLGLLWFFYRRANRENALTRFIAANAFGVYMLHPPVLIGLSLLFRFWEASAAVKFMAITPLAIAGSLGLSALFRLLPPVRAILK